MITHYLVARLASGMRPLHELSDGVYFLYRSALYYRDSYQRIVMKQGSKYFERSCRSNGQAFFSTDAEWSDFNIRGNINILYRAVPLPKPCLFGYGSTNYIIGTVTGGTLTHVLEVETQLDEYKFPFVSYWCTGREARVPIGMNETLMFLNDVSQIDRDLYASHLITCKRCLSKLAKEV